MARGAIAIETIDPVLVTGLRRMTPRERLASAHTMWRFGRARVEAAVRAQHRDWSDLQVLEAVRRRLLGSS